MRAHFAAALLLSAIAAPAMAQTPPATIGQQYVPAPWWMRDPVIASLSLGAPRRFVLRHAKVKDRSMAFLLGDGALLVMAGATQHHYRHAVPKTAEAGERINLTFRQVITPGS